MSPHLYAVIIICYIVPVSRLCDPSPIQKEHLSIMEESVDSVASVIDFGWRWG